MFSDMTDDICPHCNRSIHEKPDLSNPHRDAPYQWSDYGRSVIIELDLPTFNPFDMHSTIPPKYNLFTEDEIDEVLEPLDIVRFEHHSPITSGNLNDMIDGKFNQISVMPEYR